MRVGVFAAGGTVSEIVSAAKGTAARGLNSFWTPQIFQVDALTALAVVAEQVTDIELGTFVVPTYPRHPMALAAQALTVQQVSGGRLTLGIGLSHQIVIESMLGMSYGKPVRHLREYLSILMPLVRQEAVGFEGETLTANVALDIPADPIPVIVAALGPQLLKVAGTRAEGTGTWMTGPATIASHIAPTINAAAEAAGRPAPRVVAGLPVAVTDDPTAARNIAAENFAVYGQLPSYKAMLDREGVAGPADVAIVGSANVVRAGIEKMIESGVTEFVAAPFMNEEATLDCLGSLI